ncbi:MAG TPA: hypothetical protein VNR64_21940 [Vicinamibacterales bacterium]|nr:hypothetical protein [Vicinamibacterales bacterium]
MTCFTWSSSLAVQAAQLPAPVPLDYEANRPLDVQPLSPADRQGVIVRQITYQHLDGTRNAATLVAPADPRVTHLVYMAGNGSMSE